MTGFDEPLSIGALLDGAMRQARRHIKTVFPAVAVPMALFAGAVPFVQWLWLPEMLGHGGAGAQTPGRMFSAIGTMFAVLSVFMAVYVVGYAALTAGALDAVAGREVSMLRAWRSVVRPRVLLALLVVYSTSFVGLMCCALPGIYLYTLWSLVVPVMVEERRTLIDGLGHSTDLARYNPRREFATDPRVRAFLIFLVGTVAMYAVALVVQLPVSIAQQVMMMRGMAGGEHLDPLQVTERLVWLQVPSSVIASLAQSVVQLFISCGLALLYFDVRSRREGADLEAAVGGLERSAPAALPPSP